jgi:hypothetical protein
MGANLMFYVKPPVVEPEWTSEYFDNTHWTVNIGSWGGSYYNDDFYDLDLDVLGIWAQGYRPTKIRAYFSGGSTTGTLTLKDSVGATIASGAVDGFDGVGVDITFAGNDIENLFIHFTGENVMITAIEFYGVPV